MNEADTILAHARARAVARVNAEPRIDYERMNRELPKQKAALTRAIRSGDPRRVVLACRNAVLAWRECGAWPDDWSRWQSALNDATYPSYVDLEDLD